MSRRLQIRLYRAHLVTLQVALQPKARNLPYDVYLERSILLDAPS